jgi:hypothetical protein
MNNKQKRARFRQLAQHDRIQTGRQLAKEIEQPCLDLDDHGARLIDDVVVTNLEERKKQWEREAKAADETGLPGLVRWVNGKLVWMPNPPRRG